MQRKLPRQIPWKIRNIELYLEAVKTRESKTEDDVTQSNIKNIRENSVSFLAKYKPSY